MNGLPNLRRTGHLLAVATLLLSALLLGGGRAAAAPGPVYGTFTLDGSSGDFTGTMTLAPGFPAATYTSNSLAPAAVPSGTSAFLRAGTPFAGVYGSSAGQRYLNLRPAANNASSPSITTYSFDSPTPATGWGFALGDIDADRIAVSATGVDGLAVPVADLGFAGTFNYCSPSLAAPAPSSCGGATDEVPTWDPVTGVLTGNAAADDSFGATGWFQPMVPLSTLSFEFTWRGGFPIYQTWFATETAAVSGTVSVVGDGGLSGVVVEIVGANENIVGTAITGPDGTYSIDGLALGEYTARVIPPDGYVSAGDDPTTPADLSDGDRVGVDFFLAVLYPVGGTVTAGGRPVEGATIDCLDQGQALIGTVLTDEAGVYVCPPVRPGNEYSVILVGVPEGFEIGDGAFLPFDVVDAGVTDLDFTVISNLTVGGSVIDREGASLPDIPVSLLDDQGTEVDTTTTDENGTYEFAGVPSGVYTVVVGPTAEFEQVRVDGVVAGGAPVPAITLAPPPPVTVSPTASTVTLAPTTVTTTLATTSTATSTSSSTTVVLAVVRVKLLSATGTHASQLAPIGAGLMVVGGVLMLLGRRRGGTHLG